MDDSGSASFDPLSMLEPNLRALLAQVEGSAVYDAIVDVHRSYSACYFKLSDDTRMTSLHLACLQGSAEAVEAIAKYARACSERRSRREVQEEFSKKLSDGVQWRCSGALSSLLHAARGALQGAYSLSEVQPRRPAVRARAEGHTHADAHQRHVQAREPRARPGRERHREK